MRNLVTGGAGFIGTNLINQLMKSGEEVICLDNLQTGSLSNLSYWLNNPKFNFINENIENPIFIDLDIDRIWHFACPASPLKYQIDPIATSKTIFIGTYNMLELARKKNAKFLFASSSEVYGNTLKASEFTMCEDDLNFDCPRNCYSIGKRYNETMCFDYSRKFKLEIRIARIFNTYGPHMSPRDGRVVSNFICKAIQQISPELYGGGEQTRTFCYIDDLVNGLFELMNSSYKKPVNLGGLEEIKIKELCSLVVNKFNKELIPIVKDPLENDPIKRKPDISIAKKFLNWQPKTSLDEGLNKTINYFKKIL